MYIFTAWRFLYYLPLFSVSVFCIYYLFPGITDYFWFADGKWNVICKWQKAKWVVLPQNNEICFCPIYVSFQGTRSYMFPEIRNNFLKIWFLNGFVSIIFVAVQGHSNESNFHLFWTLQNDKQKESIWF